MEFAKTLKALRLESHLTQVQLAEKLGVTDSAVRHWETQGREPDYKMLCQIAKVLDVTVGYLLGVED
ncbi:MAG: helix-turn-helix domain-containing protein [Firmicutes bacterium]|nr:helix-turn-helix domain-containing protein [Bacillota bacterium]